MKKLRVIFLCGERSPYGLAHLRAILNSRFEVVAVVVATDARWGKFREALAGKDYLAAARGSSGWRWFKDLVKSKAPAGLLRLAGRPVPKWKAELAAARAAGRDLWVADDVNDPGFVKRVKDAGADLLISAAYPQIFRRELLAAVPRGGVNFHPSLLPRFRGAHPHFWAIATGEREGGVTAHIMTEILDAGDVIAQRSFAISALNYSQHYDRIIAETPGLVRQVEAYFLDGVGGRMVQDESRASLYRNDRPVHHRIFWDTQTAREIHNLIRTERAFTFHRHRRLVLLNAEITPSNRNLTNGVNVPPGVLVDVSTEGICIITRDGCLLVRDVVRDWRQMAALQWAVWARAEIGERFE